MEEAANSISKLDRIKKSKNNILLNKSNFLKNFGCFDYILRLKELDMVLNSQNDPDAWQ